MFARDLYPFRDVGLIDIADGRELHARVLEKNSHHATSSPSGSDQGHRDAIVGSETPGPGAGSQKPKARRSHSGDKVAAVHAILGHGVRSSDGDEINAGSVQSPENVWCCDEDDGTTGLTGIRRAWGLTVVLGGSCLTGGAREVVPGAFHLLGYLLPGEQIALA